MTIEQAKQLLIGDIYRPIGHRKSNGYRVREVKENGVIIELVYITDAGKVSAHGHVCFLKYDNAEFWAERDRVGSNRVGLTQ